MATRKTKFGQVVVGPPGSGKTTYCHAMADMLRAQKRPVCLVNLDPANDVLPYPANIDISALITVQDVMESFHLGPNGGLIYCMEFLEKNLDWLFTQVSKFSDHYFIFDFPGQVELYTHNKAVSNILEKMQQFGFRLCCVQLVDSHYCSDPAKFISVLLMSLTSMLQLALPQVNVLSKLDLAERYGKLQFGLDFYTDVLDLNYLLDALNIDPFTKKFHKLNGCLVEVIENYSLVSFIPMSVNDSKSVDKVRAAVDKANGYIFGSGEERNVYALFSSAVGAKFQDELVGAISEKYLDQDSDGEPRDENCESMIVE